MRITALLLVAVVVQSCAAAITSPSLDDFQRLHMVEVSGLFTPMEWHVEGWSHARNLAALEKWAYVKGYTVSYADLTRKSLLGHTAYEDDLMGWVVFVDQRVPPNQQFATLLHELAHIAQPQKLNQTESEVFAELVSHQVCGKLGLDNTQQVVAYLSRYTKPEEQWRVVLRHWEELDKVVAELFAAASA